MLVNKEIIKDSHGKIVGYIDTDHTGNKIARDFYGRIVGRYNKTSNMTRDFYGRIVARGDVTTSMLYRK